MKFQGKTALVVGGTTGIGLESARALHRQGARVVVTGVNEARMAEARRELGEEVEVLRGDFSVPADIDRLFCLITERFGYLDILFANAGIGTLAPLEAVTEVQIDEQFSLNFKGVFFAVQKSVPLMSKGGSVILTTSFLNETGTPGFSILAASKAAVRSLARTLGAELVSRGIRVNAVSPGPVSTPFHGKLGLTPEELNVAAVNIESLVPMHRFGEASEVANAVVFLASDESSFITGTEIVVDGGLTQF
jgi:NAD(P)-dependent dehydrogenase (short-subunit alcohol dehydrogenase family)